jgi:protein-histidine pros-kinase
MNPAPRYGTVLARILERRYRDLLDAAPDAMVIVDGHGEIVLVNQQTERTFGYHRDELLGRSVEALVPERFRGGHGAHRAAYLHEPRPRPMGSGLELYALRKDGSEFPTEISLSAVETEEGRLVIAALRDTTDRRQAEEERQELLARERVARKAAEDASRARDELMAIVSHDLQNLLNALALNIAVLLRTPAASEAEMRMRQCGETIGRSAGAMSRLLRDLLEATRIEVAGLSVRPAPQEAGSLVRQAVELLGPVAAEKQVVLEVRVAGDTGTVLCERERIEQALHNLVGNAIHFTPAGGRVVVSTEPHGDEVQIAVADSGPGIAPEDARNLFDRFWQGRGASRHGIGLGLFIVKSIVDAHGGRLWVASSPGSGATFVFTLPSAEPRQGGGGSL